MYIPTSQVIHQAATDTDGLTAEDVEDEERVPSAVGMRRRLRLTRHAAMLSIREVASGCLQQFVLDNAPSPYTLLYSYYYINRSHADVCPYCTVISKFYIYRYAYRYICLQY